MGFIQRVFRGFSPCELGQESSSPSHQEHVTGPEMPYSQALIEEELLQSLLLRGQEGVRNPLSKEDFREPSMLRRLARGVNALFHMTGPKINQILKFKPFSSWLFENTPSTFCIRLNLAILFSILGLIGVKYTFRPKSFRVSI